METTYQYEVTVCGQRRKARVEAGSLDEARKLAKQRFGIIRHVTRIEARCTCPRTCNCQRFPTHVSNECPEHNFNPMPAADCRVHGED